MTLLESTSNPRPRAKSKFFWTEDREDELRQLWTVEKWTSGQIAMAFDVTRNTVMGKIGRMGLQGRVCDVNNRRNSAVYQQALMHIREKNAAARAEKAARAPRTDLRNTTPQREKVTVGDPGLPAEPFDAAPAIPAAAPCSLLELHDDKCHWPIGEPREPDFHFCGGRATEGPYCAGHHRIAYRRA